MLDLYNRIDVATVKVAGAQITATFESTKVDILDGSNDGANGLVFIVQAGTITDGTFTFSLEDSPDDNTYTAVASPYIQAPASLVWNSSTASGSLLKLGYLGNANGASRYVKLKCVVTGSPGTGGYISAVAVLGHLGHLNGA